MATTLEITTAMSPQKDKSLVPTEIIAFAESFDGPESTRYPVLLHAYNFFRKHPNASTELLDQEKKACQYIIDTEAHYATHDNPLILMGVELEDELSPESRDILTGLGIKYKKEYDSERKHRGVWEIITYPSFSAETQITTLQQLITAGIVKRIPGLGSNTLTEGYSAERLSLHLNFQLPEKSSESSIRINHSNDISRLSDALAIAYTSAERVEQRKTQNSWDIKRADAIPDRIGNKYLSPIRLELRVNELTDHLSYDLLYVAQRLVTCFGLYTKQQDGGHISIQEQQLVNVWKAFDQANTALLKEYNIPKNFPDKDKAPAMIILSDEIMKQRFRGLMIGFANSINQTIDSFKL